MDLEIRVLCDVWAYVSRSCRRYVSILQSAWECTRESRWHRGKDLDFTVLDRIENILSRAQGKILLYIINIYFLSDKREIQVAA